MTPALASLLALLLAIVLSMTSSRNIGLLAMAMAWIIGVGVAHLKPDAIAAGFPGSLFVTLVGVTLLFAIAETNGTLARLAERAVRMARGDARWLPLLFFLVTAAISTVGPGAVAAVALVAPMAMVVGWRAGVSPFLMALMVANGANAGNLSPISAVGVIVNTKMSDVGLAGHGWRVWAANAAAHILVAAVAYVMLRGWTRTAPGDADVAVTSVGGAGAATSAQTLTTVAIGLWIAAVILLGWHPGLSALAVAVTLLLLRAGDESAAIKAIPWPVVLMVCGVSVLIALLEKTGGMALFTNLLAKMATPTTVNGAIAFVLGAISTYSSTSGVVLPAFLPTIPGLIKELGGGDPLGVALSINVGSALVDVSPLSTLGALCIAAAPPGVDTKRLFRQLLVWGLSMTVVGAILCQLFANWFAHA